jgi:hypothetical protein
MKSMRDPLKRPSIIGPIHGLVAGYGGNPRMHGLVAAAARIQGLYYLATGSWPLLNYPSFERVTGPKQEAWLVQTVGGLIAVIGVALLTARSRRLTPDVVVLAVGSALALAIGDLAHSSGTLHPWVYTLDACIEFAIAALWIVGWRRAQRPHAGLRSLPRLLERQGAS